MTRCDCGTEITFAPHERTGNVAPLEANASGPWVIVDGAYRMAGEADEGLPRYGNHYATCPAAKEWRARTRARD
jgi:hypothetical protein